MSPSRIECTHERAPGTTTCLRCLREERHSTGSRRRRAFFRLVAALVVIVGIGGAGVASAVALQRHGAASTDASAQAPVALAGEPSPVVAVPDSQPTTSALAPIDSQPAIDSATTVAPVPQLVAPTIAAGRTALGDQMYAERLGDTVVVSFDTETGRTRRADKLERIIRVTLPKVFGAVADSTLVALADRQLVAPRANLVANLASEGLQLASPDGSSRFAIHASVREGRDGPLVVGYRAILVR